VIEQVRRRPHVHFALAQACFQHRVLSEELALAEFGAEIFRRAQMEAPGLTAAPIAGADALEPPACFMVPGAFQSAEPPCSTCPAAAKCMAGATVIENAVLTKTGSLDPVLEHQRALGRERTRRFRLKAARDETGGLARASPATPSPTASPHGPRIAM
jgi:hypothetical protein